jgi:hypothetical protein
LHPVHMHSSSDKPVHIFHGASWMNWLTNIVEGTSPLASSHPADHPAHGAALLQKES